MKGKYKLKATLFSTYMNLKNSIIKYEREKKEQELHKKQQTEAYNNLVKELDKLKEEINKLLTQKENEINKDKDKKEEMDYSIEELKLNNELEELKAQEKLEIAKIECGKDIEILTNINDGKITSREEEFNQLLEANKRHNEVKIMELKYKCLKDQIYNDKAFDELINIAKKKKEEIIKDELEEFKQQKTEVEKYKKESERRLQNLKEKNNSEIQKKFIELQNYKLTEYNKLLIEKNKRYEEFRTNFSKKKVSNENLKNKEIEKARIYFEQQKNNLMFREQIFQNQKMYINSFIKQLEINDDEYSRYILSLIK